MTCKYAISVMEELKEEWYKEPNEYYHRKKIDFEYQSYRRSGIKELIEYIGSAVTDDPVTLVENFRYMSAHFASRSKTDMANFMFSIYCEVATDVLDVFKGICE